MNLNAPWIRWTPHRAWRAVAGGLMVLTLSACAGCQAMAVAAYASGLFSQRKVEAEYILPDGPLAILIDDFTDVVQPPLAKDALHDDLTEALRQHDAVVSPITTREELARIRQVDPEFDKKSVREVGRLVNADTILWIKPTRYNVYDHLDLAHSDGSFTVVVKVFDVHAEELEDVRLWPDNRDGHEVTVTISVHDIRESTSRAEVHRKIAGQMAEEICKIFYTHHVDR